MGVFRFLSEPIIHFSKIIGTTLFKDDGTRLGKIVDFFVDYSEPFPQVLAVQFAHKKNLYYVSWNNIKTFSFVKVVVENEAIIRNSRTFPKVNSKKMINRLLSDGYSEETVDYPPVGKVILDRQIVDTNGKKVVRVNDISFMKIGPLLRITDAEVGLRSMMRRLGWEKVIDPVVKIARPKAKYLKGCTRISWKFVHVIPDKAVHATVKLNLSNDELNSIHPADLADILEDLDQYGRETIFKGLDPEKKAQTIVELEQDFQGPILEGDTPEEAAKIIENMDTDDAADILSELDQEQVDQIISNIDDDEIQEEIQELLEYEEDTAGGLMTTDIIEVQPDITKENILKLIAKDHKDFDIMYDFYVVDKENKLMGTCSMRRLLIEQENLPIKDIMRKDDIKFLPPDTPWKKCAEMMSKYNLINIPITDEKNELLGAVSVDDVLPWLLDERG